MLKSLHISNYALIDSIDIEFGPGFNVITGETGAGKSIILGALSLLLSGRADTRQVADASRKSIIEAVFETEGEHASDFVEFCNRNDIDCDGSQFILRREIAANGGRSRAFVNDGVVSLATLQAIALQLIDIHSQHQNLLLSRPDYQLEVLDAYAGNKLLKESYREEFGKYRRLVGQVRRMREDLARSRADEDYLRFQLQQIEALSLQPGEQADLENEREIAGNIADLKESMSTVAACLDGDYGAVTLIRRASQAAASLTRLLGDDISERLAQAEIELKDILRTVEDHELEDNPGRLQQIEQRLDAIYTLEKRHNADDSDRLIEIAAALRAKLSVIDNGDEEIKATKALALKSRERAVALARKLSESRRKAAGQLGSELQATAMPLGMKNLQVDIHVDDTDLSATGADKVDFLFAFNKNQPLSTVAGVASGGEISRLMLSVKAIMASRMRLPSIIFDEIDTGVSGDVANRIGDMLHEMGRDMQVIAITHLPTVAARGMRHFKVFKYDDDNSTHTSIRRLDDGERIGELAVMLSGNAGNAEARRAAESLLKR